MSRRVVIVSVSLGYGHHSISASIKEALAQEGIPAQVIDLLEESSTLQKIKELYFSILEKTPALYGNAYFLSRKAGSTTGLFYLLCRKSLERVRQRFQPAAFVFVHPFGLSAYRTACGVPAFAVISDLSFHASWYNREIKGYFVAREAIGNALVQRGYPQEQVYCTGIPLAAAFCNAGNSESKKAVQGRKPLVLVMGGGLGLGAIEEMVDMLEELEMPLQGAILTGQNSWLQQRLTVKLSAAVKEWYVLPFMKRVDLLMKQADLLISKGGAVTLSEAAACGLPVIVYRPLPGHERENAAVAAEEGWAWQAEDKLSLQRAVWTLLNEPEKRIAMSRLALGRGNPLAASWLARIMKESLKNNAWRRSS